MTLNTLVELLKTKQPKTLNRGHLEGSSFFEEVMNKKQWKYLSGEIFKNGGAIIY